MSHAVRLTAPQERDLLIAAEQGDQDARRRLVEAFLPSILGLAVGFRGVSGLDREDLVQEGVAGLLLATRRYDTTLTTPFWAYASFWVRKAMQELVADLTRPVALSDRAVKALAAIRAARREFLQAHAAEPSTDQLRQATGLSRTQLESLLAADRPARSMDERLTVDGDGAGTVGDRVTDPGAEAAYDAVLDQIERGEVRGLAEQLGERERTVLRAHYGLGEPPQTLAQIGGRLGLTAERARQIEMVALGRLRAALGAATSGAVGAGSVRAGSVQAGSVGTGSVTAGSGPSGSVSGRGACLPTQARATPRVPAARTPARGR